MRLFSLAALVFVFIAQPVSSQVISVEVSKNGEFLTVKLDGNAVSNGEGQNIFLSRTSSLRFDFSGVQDKTATFRITSAITNGNPNSIELDSNYFKVATTISSDNNLKLKKGSNIVDLSKPFQIGIASGKSNAAIDRIFIPQLNTSIAETQSDASHGASDGDDAEEEEKQYQPGSAVYDALKLADNAKLSGEELKIIVKYYFPDENVDDEDRAKALLDATPFLKDLGLKIIPLKINRGSAQAGGNILSSLSASAIGGLDVTAFADGLAKFLVKRTKQELSVAFFKKFKDIIEKTKDLNTLFPNTADQLSNVGDEIYDYERYIQNLREAFKKDITAIHYNLPGIIPNHQAFFTQYRALGIGINTGCYIARELEKRTHPGDILAAYPFEYLDESTDMASIGTIKTIQLFSASLRDTATSEDANYWVSIGKLRELVNNRRALKIYFGLVYRESINRYGRVQYGGGANLTQVLENASAQWDAVLSTYDSYRRYILRLGDKVDALNKMIQEYKNMEFDSSGLEKYAKYFKASIDLIGYCTEASELPLIKGNVPDIKESLQKYFLIAYEVTDLVVDAYKKNYSAAVNHVVKVYNLVRTKPLQDPGVTAAQRASFDAPKDDANNSITVLARLVKYGSFLSTLATAKNSDEVAKAIETAALPIGSSRIKRESPFNVTLNAYTGLFIGRENIVGVKDDKGINTYGVTAPVGISISKGHSIFFIPVGGWREGKRGWSTSLFISLIDIGAVTAYRFKNEEAAEVPTIQLKNIISPGAFISLGIPKTPLSFNVGAQMGPNLRKVSGTSADNSDRRYWRFSTAFCVDIPLFNLYTRSR
jgi:hypothetical protein